MRALRRIDQTEDALITFSQSIDEANDLLTDLLTDLESEALDLEAVKERLEAIQDAMPAEPDLNDRD